MKNLYCIILALLGLCSAGSFASCSRQSAAAGAAGLTPADSLRRQLTNVRLSGKTMFGHHDDPVYGHEWCGDSNRSDILETAGAYPAMMSWDLGGIELGQAENLDGVPFARMADEVRRQHERGGFNTFSWHLYSPVDSADSWTVGDSLAVVRIVTDSAVNAAFRNQVKSVASFFNSLTDAAGNAIPVIFRPFHEHTGNWFWWGKPYATPEQYRALWQIVAEEFDRAGVDNVLFAYSPDRVNTTEEYMEYYPGDDVVDIVGVDIYQFNGAEGAEGYLRDAGRALDIVCSVADEHGKIPAFTETGSEGVPMERWWTDMLLPLIHSHRLSYVVVWRNAHDKPGHFFAPFPSHPSADSFKAFCADSTLLLVND